MLGIMRNLILRLISTDASLATHVNALNFNHINKIEARYKVVRSNMRLSEVLLLRLYVRPFIHCLYFICERKFYAHTNGKITQ